MAAVKDATGEFYPSYGRDWIILSYGVIWLIVLAAGYTLVNPFFASGNTLLALIFAAALAGGLGGATAMLQRLSRHLLAARDWPNQPFFTYFLQPLTGLIAGMLSLLMTLPGDLLVNYAATRTLTLANLTASSTFVALSLLLAWIAGYYQETVLAKIRPAAGSAESKALTTLAKTTTNKAPESNGSRPESPLAFQAWVEQRQRMSRWSLIWGVIILVYGLVWLVGLVAGFLGSGSLFPLEAEGNSLLVNLLAAGWPAILAGGMGGVVGMFYDLYRHISFEQDFDRPHLVAYPILPFTGLVLGGAMYLFVASGYLSLKSLAGEAPPVVDSPAVIAGYIVLGWLAGFRQQSLHGLIRGLIQALVKFVRGSLSGLSPKVLWDQANRDETLSEVARQWELFGQTDRDTSPRLKDKISPSE
ncbi:MAG: hypothetical protein BroJett011_32220 [Chloroflexota bacterium]|nr:MAG: hypothetical protein BroJett011_32220 [Chloroflexota bacterium]